MTCFAKATKALVPNGGHMFKVDLPKVSAGRYCRPSVSRLTTSTGRSYRQLTGFNPHLGRIKSNASHAFQSSLSRSFASDVRSPELSEKKIQHLNLPEMLVILSLNDKGKLPFLNNEFQMLVTVASILHLILKDVITIEHGKVKLHSTSASTDSRKSTLGSPALDECITKIRHTSSPRSLEKWVKLLYWSPLLSKVVQGLLNKGILTEKNISGFWNNLYLMPRYELHSPSSREQIVSDLRNAVLSTDREVDVCTTLLITLCKHLGLLRDFFTEQELDANETRILEISKGKLLDEIDQSIIRIIKEIDLLNLLLALSSLNNAIVSQAGCVHVISSR